MKYYSSKARQAGMTLIELTVVLLVLIGLAGLMIPYVSGFVSKTHDSTGDNNIAELNNTIQRYQAQTMRFPNDLQSLVDVTTPGTPKIYSKLMNTDPLVYVPKTYTVGTNKLEVASLKKAGISSIMSLGLGSPSATFNAAGPVTTLTGTNSVGMLTVGLGAETQTGAGGDAYGSIEAHLADATGQKRSNFNATCNDYVILGIGQENSMIGKAMSDAPVHFAQNGNMGPDFKYNRFVAIFEVDKANGTPAALATNSKPVSAAGIPLTVSTTTGTGATATTTPGTLNCGVHTHPAKFIGTAMLMSPPHLWGLAHSLGHTYNNIAAGN